MAQYQFRSTWWLITAYDKNLELLESYGQPNADRSTIPRGVRAIHGGVEVCPTTGRRHFQGAIECNGQQRAVFFRDWLPGVHFEVAKNKDAVKKYCLKADTAEGVKGTVSNPVQYLTMDKLLMKFGERSLELYEVNDPAQLEMDKTEEFWKIANMLIMESPGLVSMIATPTLRTVWQQTRETWRALVLQARQTRGDECMAENKISGSNTNGQVDFEEGHEEEGMGIQAETNC